RPRARADRDEGARARVVRARRHPRRALPRRPAVVSGGSRPRPPRRSARGGRRDCRASSVPVTRTLPTAEVACLVYGAGGVGADDPAEECHEASRLYPNIAPGRLSSLVALAQRPELQETVGRSSTTHGHREGIDLSRGALPDTAFSTLVARRR